MGYSCLPAFSSSKVSNCVVNGHMEVNKTIATRALACLSACALNLEIPLTVCSETGEVAQLTRRDTAAGTESVGDTTSPQTSGPVCSMVLIVPCQSYDVLITAACTQIFHLGPGGTAIQTSYLALVLGVSAMCGALAGFIGFGKCPYFQHVYNH